MRPVSGKSSKPDFRNPRIIEAAKRALGTQTVHKDLEHALARFLGVEDVMLYSSCFDANGGLFETLVGEEDAVIADA